MHHVIPGYPNKPSPNPIDTFFSFKPASKGALSSLCARHCLIQFKVVYRAHMSKFKLAMHIFGHHTYLRQMQISVHHYFSHVLAVPRLQVFWNEVFHTL